MAGSDTVGSGAVGSGASVGDDVATWTSSSVYRACVAGPFVANRHWLVAGFSVQNPAFADERWLHRRSPRAMSIPQGTLASRWVASSVGVRVARGILCCFFFGCDSGEGAMSSLRGDVRQTNGSQTKISEDGTKCGVCVFEVLSSMRVIDLGDRPTQCLVPSSKIFVRGSCDLLAEHEDARMQRFGPSNNNRGVQSPKPTRWFEFFSYLHSDFTNRLTSL